jgi:hypothetical protein
VLLLLREQNEGKKKADSVQMRGGGAESCTVTYVQSRVGNNGIIHCVLVLVQVRAGKSKIQVFQKALRDNML